MACRALIQPLRPLAVGSEGDRVTRMGPGDAKLSAQLGDMLLEFEAHFLNPALESRDRLVKLCRCRHDGGTSRRGPRPLVRSFAPPPSIAHEPGRELAARLADLDTQRRGSSRVVEVGTTQRVAGRRAFYLTRRR